MMEVFVRPYSVLALTLVAALTACGGGSSGGSGQSGVTPPTTSGYSLNPTSTQASPLSVAIGGEYDVTISPAIAGNDTQTTTTKSSDPTCVGTGVSGPAPGSSFNTFYFYAANGASHGCTATVTLNVAGQTLTEYAKVQ